MLSIRKSTDRGHFDHDWLDTYHTFSFSDYYDPAQMGFRSLRVMNEDRVAPGSGFGMHGHRDMEIVTYVLSGELQHMTAGSGIRHSEFNPSATEPVHLYQIWLLPRAPGLPPRYSQKAFAAEGRDGRWQLVASPDGADGSLTIEQDARIYLAGLHAGSNLAFELNDNRHAWLQVLRGSLGVNGSAVTAGDGIAVTREQQLTLDSSSSAEV